MEAFFRWIWIQSTSLVNHFQLSWTAKTQSCEEGETNPWIWLPPFASTVLALSSGFTMLTALTSNSCDTSWSCMCNMCETKSNIEGQKFGTTNVGVGQTFGWWTQTLDLISTALSHPYFQKWSLNKRHWIARSCLFLPSPVFKKFKNLLRSGWKLKKGQEQHLPRNILPTMWFPTLCSSSSVSFAKCPENLKVLFTQTCCYFFGLGVLCLVCWCETCQYDFMESLNPVPLAQTNRASSKLSPQCFAKHKSNFWIYEKQNCCHRKQSILELWSSSASIHFTTSRWQKGITCFLSFLGQSLSREHIRPSGKFFNLEFWYRWVPFNPNMNNPNFQKSWSLFLSPFCHAFWNSLNSKVFTWCCFFELSGWYLCTKCHVGHFTSLLCTNLQRKNSGHQSTWLIPSSIRCPD